MERSLFSCQMNAGKGSLCKHSGEVQFSGRKTFFLVGVVFTVVSLFLAGRG